MTDVVEPITEQNPYLTWMTGKLSTSERQMALGWHVHKGVNPPLDALLERLKYQHHLVEHDDELVEYWALNSRWDSGKSTPVQVPCSLFVVARGLKSTRDMNRDPKDRDGIAYGWEVSRDNAGNPLYKADGAPKKACRVKLRAYIHELLPAPDVEWNQTNGFLDWFQVSVSGYLCDDLLSALYSQYRVMRAYDQRLTALGKSGVRTPYWALSNPMVPAETPRRVASKDKDGGSTTIIPMRTLIPTREQEITDDYLRARRIPPSLQQDLLQGEVLLSTWSWSSEESEYLEGLKPRPTRREEDTPIAASAVVVEEESPVTNPADPCIDASQQQVLLMLCNQDQERLQAYSQQYQVASVEQLRTSQFRELLVKLSQIRN